MSPRLAARLVALILPATAILAVPAAHAERVVTHDATGDADSIMSDFEEEVFTPAPDHSAVDITRTVVAHGARRVSVEVDYRDLTRRFGQAQYVKVQTPEARFDIEVARNLGQRASVSITRRSRGDVVRCPALRASYDTGVDRIGLSIPTSCLRNPEWVRIGVLSLGIERDAIERRAEVYELFFDDAHLTGGFEDHGVRLGPEVRRD